MSAQHLNLLDEHVRPPRQRYTAVQSLMACAALLALGGLAAASLHWAAQGRQEELDQTRLSLNSLQAQWQAPPALASVLATQARELQALREQDHRQQALALALSSGSAGRREGYADHLRALWHQGGSAQLWLTGFRVDGQDMEIAGRMTDAAALPPYLRQLNEEPLFQGRLFAQLNVSTPTGNGVGNGAGNEAGSPSFTEFLLTTHEASGSKP
ncbi:MAG TPA: PilN domain-containing protein [Burkholderiaceae bacterium]